MNRLKTRSLTGVIIFVLALTTGFLSVPPSLSAHPDHTSGPEPQTVQAESSSLFAEAIAAFERFAEARMAVDKTTGLSVAFFKDDFVWGRGFGSADLENGTPAKAESSYRLASITKTITAVALLRLVEAGKIDLDAEVQAYIPDFPKKKWPVTIRAILGHLAGISHYRNDALEGHIKEPKTTKQALAIFQDFDLIAEPWTRYSYSSYGFNLLGAVIEKASGEPYGVVIRRLVFEPLGMADSRLDSPTELIPNRVRGYRLVKGEIRNSEYVDVSSRFAGGGTRSTVLDLLKYARGLMEGKLLKNETTRMMWTSLVQKDGRLTGYGLGWGIRPWKGHFQAGHGGSQPETRTYLLILPTERFALAVASNYEGANLMPYVKMLAELVLGEDLDTAAYAPRLEQRVIYEACTDVFSHGLSSYLWNGAPLTEDPKALKEAFDYFSGSASRAALRRDMAGARKRIALGVHPASRQAFVKAGSFMASVLAEAHGPESLRGYHKSGPLAFFKDYIEAAASPAAAGRMKPPRFHGDLKGLVSSWEKDWTKSSTEPSRYLDITAWTDFKELGEILRPAFAKASLVPDFSAEMAAAAAELFEKKDEGKAMEALSLARELYPESPVPHSGFGDASALTGKVDEAKDHFRRAFLFDSAHPSIGPDHFLELVGRMRRAGKGKEAEAVVETALEFHPQSGGLLVAAGDFAFARGEKDKAIALYEKALEAEPELESAKTKLKAIKK